MVLNAPSTARHASVHREMESLTSTYPFRDEGGDGGEEESERDQQGKAGRMVVMGSRGVEKRRDVAVLGVVEEGEVMEMVEGDVEEIDPFRDPEKETEQVQETLPVCSIPASSPWDDIKCMELRGFLVTPLMSGVQYRRETPTPTAEQPAGGQYAVPLDASSSSTINESIERDEQRAKVRPLQSICRRARKMQVRMPSIKKKRGVCKLGGETTSDPEVFRAIAYEDVDEGPPPTIMTRYRYGDPFESLFESSLGMGRDSSSVSLPRNTHIPQLLPATSCNVQGLNRFEEVEQEGSVLASRRNCKTPPPRPRRPDDLRPTLSAASTVVDTPRSKKSFGSFLMSDASTFVAGEAPPPYASRRPVSIVTTSSFGCIDGMPLEQRYRDKARGVKGTIKRIVRKANIKFSK